VKTIFQKLNFFLRQERGASMAELAILVPILILLLAAVSEFGRFFQQYTTLAKSTRTAARYLSNHSYPDNQAAARNLVVCGKLTCTGSDALIPGFTAANVCIESTTLAGSPKIETVTVSVPRTGGAGACAQPFNYQPIFNIGALLNTGFTFTPAISPSVTMYYMID
jgi:Flp pilus assembly pilin Flp